MINILHLTETSEIGGSETVLAYIAKNLDAGRFHSTVCLMEDGWLRGELDRLGVNYVMVENKRPYDPVFIMDLMRLVRKMKIDIVHGHEFVTTFYGAAAATLTGIPAMGNIHGKGYFTEKARRRFAYKVAIKMCSRIVAVSNDLKTYLIQELNLKKPGKISIIPNGIDVKKYVPCHPNFELRRKLEIPDDALLVGTVGALTPVKGLGNLVRAAAKIIEVHPDFRLLIIGEGEQEAVLKKTIASLNLTKNILMTGFRSDIPALLNLLDIYVCSSLSEGLSLSILEAMSAGLPIIATDVGGNPEIVEHGANGFLVRRDNHEALANGIIDLLNNKKLRISMGRKGREIVENKYSLDRMIERYQNLYQDILA